ncbi:DUF445 domain-containing protein [Amnimonas aquatica]|uniref:DUF445 domain-containing protein n=1 Tax=Amnimonas aquatica TaxID=2094561 RepID=A0A2P6AUC3_9GAMM|nr:DUF445 family protein [Amnimonas aquatica]PQA49460.1 DUF445 domain-containing protein [Amnimonas aquatica]
MIEQAIADFQANMWLYISIPFISGIIGYVTKVVAIQMMFSPLEFKGIKPFFGWQGIVPRKAEKMATVAVELMTSKLIKPSEIFARLDPQRVAKEIEAPMMAAAEDIVRDVAQQYQPGLWESMPEFARQKIIQRVKGEAPAIVATIMSEVQRDIDKYFDIKHMVISNLLKDKRLLNDIFRKVGRQEFRFFSNAGFYFGFGIGLIQMVCWALFKQPWMLPAFGGFVGFFSDWIALQMMFRPLHPKKVLGFTWQGLFLKRQKEVAADYAALISKQLLTPANMMQELFRGAFADRIMELIHKNVKRTVDEQTGIVRPLVVYAVGSQKYIEMKSVIAERIMAQMPETMKHVESYAEDAMDVRNTLVERMQGLSSEEFEGMLRPAFKEDEWSLIIVGAVLGFLVGEMQIHFML